MTPYARLLRINDTQILRITEDGKIVHDFEITAANTAFLAADAALLTRDQFQNSHDHQNQTSNQRS